MENGPTKNLVIEEQLKNSARQEKKLHMIMTIHMIIGTNNHHQYKADARYPKPIIKTKSVCLLCLYNIFRYQFRLDLVYLHTKDRESWVE